MRAPDARRCNGTPYCDLASRASKPNPATAVHCPAVGDTLCLRNTCRPKTGECAAEPEKEGVVCDDGDPCTAGDACAGGACKPGKTGICPCKTDGDCAGRDDGDLCDGTLYCDKSKAPYQCRPNPATVLSCPSADDTVCRHNASAPKTGQCGFVARSELAACEAEGNPCTQSDHCEKGARVAGTKLCTCSVDHDCATPDDGDLCDGGLYCDRKRKDPK